MVKEITSLFLMAMVAAAGGIMFWSFLSIFIEKKWIKVVLIILMELFLIHIYVRNR